MISRRWEKTALVLMLLWACPREAAAGEDRYFKEGPFAKAQRLMAQGEAQKSLELLRRLVDEQPDAPEVPQARYLIGLGLMRLGDYEAAERVFGELAVSYPELRQDHLFYRGKALVLWGNYLEAATVLRLVSPRSAHGAEARRLRARALFRASSFTELRNWLEELLRDEGRLEPEILFYLANARHRTRDVLGALRAFQEVWREAPRAAFAAEALEKCGELRLGEEPLLSEGEVRAIRGVSAERALRKGRMDLALASLEERLRRAPRSALRVQVAFARGRLEQARGRLGLALEHYERVLSLTDASQGELRARAHLEKGRALERLGRQMDAVSEYDRLARELPELPESEDALFLAGEILLGRRLYEDAESKLRELLLKNPVTVHRARALRAMGWVKYRLGIYEEARRFFASVATLNLPAELSAGTKYWLAKSEQNLGNSEGAAEIFREIIRDFPLSYYAALSEDQLLGWNEAPAPPGKRGAARSPEVASADLVSIEEYVRLGLSARALAAVSAFEGKARAKGRLSEGTLRVLAGVFEALGKRKEARRLREERAREYPHRLSASELLEAARQAHPVRYEGEIRRAAEEFDLGPSLLFALVRTESAFRTDAVSAQNAYGLAQLILPTAKSVSARIRAGRVTARRLLADPAWNLRLGAAYLRQLLDRYQGSEVLALAAYNAGPGAVDAWLKGRARVLEGVGVQGRGLGLIPQADELVEEIPVDETRKYVRVVLARARSYARLLAEAEPEPQEAEPEEALPAGVTVDREPRLPGLARREREPLVGLRIQERSSPFGTGRPQSLPVPP